MRRLIVTLVEAVTLGRVRGQHFAHRAAPSLRWWYTPYAWTARYGHGGWVFLSLSWMRRFRFGA